MSETLGELIRSKRLEKKLGLREAAGKLDISPTYLSRIETSEEKSPPAEEVLNKIARLLDLKADELLSLAGRVPADIAEYISQNPGLPEVLRTAKAKNISTERMAQLMGLEKKRK